MLDYEDLRNKPKELLAATGLKHDEFEALLAAFAKASTEAHPADQTLDGQVRQRRIGGGNPGKLSGLEDKLLFILIYEKTEPLQTRLGVQFGLSQGRVKSWIHRLAPLLQKALTDMGMRPERDGAAVQNSELVQEGGADWVIDGTERRRQRPQDEDAQREQYRAKKSPHRQKSRLSQQP